MLDFRILGPLEVRDGDRLIELAGHRQQALLCALLVRANQVVPTERLVDELWGDDAPRTATRSLHNAVSLLRRLLWRSNLPPRRCRPRFWASRRRQVAWATHDSAWKRHSGWQLARRQASWWRSVTMLPVTALHR